MNRRLALLPFAFLFLLLQPAGAQAPSPVDLRFKLAAGDVLVYRFAETSRQVTQRETGDARNELQRDGTEEFRVTEVDAAGVMTLEWRRQIQRLVIDGLARNEPAPPGVRGRMTPLGSLLDVRTGEPTTQELFVLLPERAVRAGESWSRGYDHEQGRSRFTARENYVLVAFNPGPAGAVARIRATHEFIGTGGRVVGLPETVEATQRTQFSGDYDFHVEQGRVLRVSEETVEEVRFRGTVDGRPVQGLQSRLSTRRTELSAP